MPPKKTEDAPKAAPKTAPATPDPGSIRTGVFQPPADTSVLGQDIDTRLRSLEDDHIAMGSRPPR
jgi:hypothetical protein